MPICRFWQQGNCRYGNNCKFEHPANRQSSGFGGGDGGGSGPNPFRSNAQFGSQSRNEKWLLNEEDIRNDLTNPTRPRWVLSSYGPGRNAPFALFTENEFSPEEVRHRFYQQQSVGQADVADRESAALWSKALNDMSTLSRESDLGRNMTKLMEDKEQEHPNRYDFCKWDGTKSKEEFIKTFSMNTQLGSASNSWPAASTAGGASSSPFTKAASFGQSSFGQPSGSSLKPAFGSPSPFGSGATGSNNAFGKPSLGNPGFGQVGFGQPSQPRTSAFGQAAPPSSSPFGQANQPSQSPFGQAPQSTTSPFGQPAQPSNSPFGQTSQQKTSGFGQPSAFGQASALGQNPSNNAFGASPGTGFGQAQPAQPLGDSSTQSSTSGFAQQPTGQPAFGQNPFGAKPAQPAQPGFGQSPFGQQQPSQPAFGQGMFKPKQDSPFGSTNDAKPPQTGSPFGQAAQPSQPSIQPGFGQGFAAPSAFGQTGFGQGGFGQNAGISTNDSSSNIQAQSSTVATQEAQPTAQSSTNLAPTKAGAPSSLTGQPSQPLHYNQTIPQNGAVQVQPNGICTSWRGQRVGTIEVLRPDISGQDVVDSTFSIYRRPDGRGNERIWFPQAEQERTVQFLSLKRDDLQAPENRYTDEIKEQYKHLFTEGSFKDGKIPLVPPMRDWVEYDF